MSSTRFQPGQSGNPKGRPRKHRRPNVSAFEIILDKTLTITQNGKTREATVEEALQQQTLKDALAGKRLAIRKLLKMIETREKALEQKNPEPRRKIELKHHYSADNADEALRILGIAEPEPAFPTRWKVHAWATQAALSRPGRKKFNRREADNIKFFTFDPDSLKWPRSRVE
ncbi:DUF5681 domain-containing protein [Sphingorhabdus sp. 109]|jgi:hypothetical protein|uniref:DUF5681 domain-containing protein n=1 Tax=Sphingorhabdus sp. 109 TaxID=2653173 RepID=UPI0012F35E70|nr:DUF5681 domain-containing protein [Sphingorhabdus sp. 109]VWX60716.1 conserved hypothetical protein [Sphingorhabdus sp. 109]